PVLLSATARARYRTSFPTRRSSDLVSKAPVFAEPPKFDASGDGGGSDRGGGGDSGKSVSNIGNGHTGTGSPRTGPSSSSCDRSGDRKSTRLNSSHVKISYAVFCLKK